MILTFFLLSMLVLLADGWTNGWSTMNLFCVYLSLIHISEPTRPY